MRPVQANVLHFYFRKSLRTLVDTKGKMHCHKTLIITNKIYLYRTKIVAGSLSNSFSLLENFIMESLIMLAFCTGLFSLCFKALQTECVLVKGY